MASIEEALVSYLTSYSALVALIGTRFKPFHIPPREFVPCVTYKRISTPRNMTHSSSGATGDVVYPRFQFDAWAITEKEAMAISTVLQGALHGKRGTVGTAPYSVSVGLIYVDGSFPMEEPDVQLWRWVTQYVIGMVE